MMLGRYELMELIGKGGMGSVYRSRHPETGRTIAVKVLDQEMASHPVLLKRFEQECAVAIRLKHPNVVEGIEFGVFGRQPYLVMEFVDGLNLADYIAQKGKLSEAEAIRIGIEIGSALHAAHEANLIHRDVKPENVLLNKEGVAKLTDLGLVKDLEGEEELTRSGAWLGTISFMAPEQFGDARKVDARCDVYGLAATLYFGLTNTNPFPQKGSLTVLGAKLKNRYPIPQQVEPTISNALNEVIVAGLSADRKRRPASCAVLVQRFQQVGGIAPRAAAPVEAVPTPPVSPSSLVKTRVIPILPKSSLPATVEPPLTQPTPPPPSRGTVELPSAAAAVLTPAPTPKGAERRRASRYNTAVGAICKPVRGALQDWPARVEDVSLSGLRLQSGRRFESGSILEIQVGAANSQIVTFLVRVMWVRASGPGSWNHGCAFGRSIAESDLDVFLGGVTTTVVEQADEADLDR